MPEPELNHGKNRAVLPDPKNGTVQIGNGIEEGKDGYSDIGYIILPDYIVCLKEPLAHLIPNEANLNMKTWKNAVNLYMNGTHEKPINGVISNILEMSPAYVLIKVDIEEIDQYTYILFPDENLHSDITLNRTQDFPLDKVLNKIQGIIKDVITRRNIFFYQSPDPSDCEKFLRHCLITDPCPKNLQIVADIIDWFRQNKGEYNYPEENIIITRNCLLEILPKILKKGRKNKGFVADQNQFLQILVDWAWNSPIDCKHERSRLFLIYFFVYFLLKSDREKKLKKSWDVLYVTFREVFKFELNPGWNNPYPLMAKLKRMENIPLSEREDDQVHIKAKLTNSGKQNITEPEERKDPFHPSVYWFLVAYSNQIWAEAEDCYSEEQWIKWILPSSELTSLIKNCMESKIGTSGIYQMGLLEKIVYDDVKNKNLRLRDLEKKFNKYQKNSRFSWEALNLYIQSVTFLLRHGHPDIYKAAFFHNTTLSNV